MGRTICAGVVAADGLELVAAIDPGAAGQTICGVTVADQLDALSTAGARVVACNEFPASWQI